MNHLHRALITSLIVLLCISCRDKADNEATPQPSPGGKSSNEPIAVTDIQVVNRSGKSIVYYTIPSDADLLFVKAVYTMSNGEQNEVVATVYEDSLVINGFADTREHKVQLYSINGSGALSLPEEVVVQPKESPIVGILKSLQLKDYFGGFKLHTENPMKAPVGIMVLRENQEGVFEIDNDNSFYTLKDSISSTVKGLKDSTYNFGFFVEDQWGNTTDTLYKTVSPLFATELDRSKFKSYPLPGDALENPNVAGVEGLWDDGYNWPEVSFTWRADKQPEDVRGRPHMITFDLGVMAKISKFWIRPYPESGNRYYFFTALKRFEIYGSADPSLNGALDSTWHLLGSYTVKKPSGLPYGEHNNDDVQTAEAGFNWNVGLEAPEVRYIRIKCLENFGGGYQQSISEVKVYGDSR